jgi:hypothetical protein
LNLKTRLSKLEKMKRQIAIEADCVCFPSDEPPAAANCDDSGAAGSGGGAATCDGYHTRWRVKVEEVGESQPTCRSHYAPNNWLSLVVCSNSLTCGVKLMNSRLQ